VAAGKEGGKGIYGIHLAFSLVFSLRLSASVLNFARSGNHLMGLSRFCSGLTGRSLPVRIFMEDPNVSNFQGHAQQDRGHQRQFALCSWVDDVKTLLAQNILRSENPCMVVPLDKLTARMSNLKFICLVDHLSVEETRIIFPQLKRPARVGTMKMDAKGYQ